MNILVVSSSDPQKTSGIVASDLFRALSQYDSRNHIQMIVKCHCKTNDIRISSIESSIYFQKLRRLLGKLKLVFKSKYKVLNRDKKYSFQDYNQENVQFSTRKILKRVKVIPDVIIILFPQNFIMPRNMYELYLATGAQILLYPMDMSYMTGGCHYAWECKGYHSNCGNCPALFSTVAHDQSRVNWENKSKYYKSIPIAVIAPSEQLAVQFRQSSLFHDITIHKVLLPIDEKLFAPGNQAQARADLSLPPDKLIILFGAAGFPKRKGFAQLIDALQYMMEIAPPELCEKIHLAVVGNSHKARISDLPFDYTILGYVSYVELVSAYQAAELFVSPSIEDSGPMMINQSLMCGTPVVSFRTGVALDLVIDGFTGYTSPVYNIEMLAEGMMKILLASNEEKTLLSRRCREMAVRMSSMHIVADSIYKIAKMNVKQTLTHTKN